MKSYFSQANKIRLTLIERVTWKGKKAVPVADGSDSESIKVANAIDQLKGRDRVGVVGEGAVVAGSTVAGAALSGVAAGAVGATSLLGSTSLAGLLGGVFVTTTPVGWVIGSAAIAGAAGYGVVKLIRSGSQQDRVRAEISKKLRVRLAEKAEAPSVGERDELVRLTGMATDSRMLSLQSAAKMIGLVDAGALSLDLALQRTRALVEQSSDNKTS